MAAEVMEVKPQTSVPSSAATVLVDTVSPSGWAEAIAVAGGWNPLFSSEVWADYLMRWAGCRPRYVLVSAQDGTRLAAWLVFVADLAVFRRGWKRLACQPLQGLAREVVWFAPPVLYHPSQAEAVSRVLAEWLQRAAAPVPFVRVAGGPWLSGVATPLRIETWATYLVDCQGPEDELWRRLKHSARKSVRKAQERGLTVRRLQSRDEIPSYCRFAARAARASGRALVEPDLPMAWDCLRPQARLEFFVAELGGECVSGLGVRGQGAWISEVGSYQSVRDRAEQLGAQDLIKWEVIRWARSCGIRWFDLAGVNPEPATAKQAGIRQFKEKWGGCYVEFPRVRCQWLAPRRMRAAS